MDQVRIKPLINQMAQTTQKARKNSLLWSLLIAISSRLFVALLVTGLGMFALVASIEQRTWLEREADHAQHSSMAIENYLKSSWNQLALVEELDPDDRNLSLEKLIQANGWLEISHYDAQGKAIARAARNETRLPETLTSQPEWFWQAITGQRSAALVEDDGGVILAVATADGGAAAGRLTVQYLQSQLDQFSFGKTGRAYILNRSNGAVVALSTGQSPQPALYRQIVRQAGSSWSGELKNPAGKTVQVVTDEIVGTGWLLVCEVQQSEINHVGSLIWQINTAWMVVLWLVGSLTSAALMNRMVLQPLRAVYDGIKRVRMGERAYRIPAGREDEIGETAQQANELAVVLEERERRLEKAQEKALLDSQFKSDLLQNVDHNLRQPLGVFLGFTEMLRDEVLGPTTSQQRRAINDMINSTQRMSHMITDLIDSARLETQTLHLHTGEFSPALLLGQVISQMTPRAEQKGLDLSSELDPRMPEVLIGDVVRLQQVVTSLVDNAIKFTQWGSVRVYFTRSASNEWEMIVSDTGVGIPTDACTHIFEPFMQIKHQSARDVGGVGLGLFMVQQLVQLMEGSIRVESTVGIGSIFTVSLPLNPVSKERN